MRNAFSRAYKTLKSLTKPTQARSKQSNDAQNNLLTEGDAILKRWTEYCFKLYNYESKTDDAVIDSIINNEDHQTPILEDGVEAAVQFLKYGKSPGIDNIPVELITSAGEEIADVLHKVCERIWTTKTWPEQ